MTSLFLLLWACAPTDSTGPDGSGANPTEPTEPGSYEPVPMGVASVEPDTVTVHVDSVDTTCDGANATLRVDTLGHADLVEVDLIDADGVHTVALTRGPIGADDVWVSFTGTAPCDLTEAGSWVVRAHRNGDLVDCAVHGQDRSDVLAGAADALLSAAGRPVIAGCHDIAE